MSTPTFYHAELCATDSSIELAPSEASHALKSRRLREGQQIKLINGKGLTALCKITSRHRSRLVVAVERVTARAAPSRRLSIAAAIPKGDRQRSMIDFLSQYGIVSLIPLECEHSVTPFKESLLEKWRKFAIEACKQSQNPWLPEFHSAQTIPGVLNWLDQQENMHGVYGDGAGNMLAEMVEADDDLLVLIGPEGGFSAIEIEAFDSAKLPAIKLGDNILRIEAAAVSAAIQFFSRRRP